MAKDYTGNKISSYVTNGASNHSDKEREENDYYATAPLATKFLVELEKFDKNIWEPACGENHIANILRDAGYNVRCSDIIDRIGDGSIEIKDFLTSNEIFDGDIITNPPYKFALEFAEKCLESVKDGHKVAMFLKLTFLETRSRKEFFMKYPPKVIYVSANRLGCAKNGEFEGKDNIGSAVAYCWYIWEKGFTGDPIIKWFN